MSNTTTSNSGGIGFLGALTIAFIVLKLTHVITWSWWWVLSPLFIGWGFLIIFLAIFLLVVLIAHSSE